MPRAFTLTMHSKGRAVLLAALVLGGASCDKKTEPSQAAATPVDAGPPLLAPDSPKLDTELLTEAAGIIAAYSNTGARLTPDGTKVVFVSNRSADGAPQLYIAETAKPEAPAARLTGPKDLVMSAPAILPDGKSTLFVGDKGGENFSIFSLGLNGGNIFDLTPGPALYRDAPFIPDRMAGSMVFSARDVKDKATRIYIQGLSELFKPKLVYSDPGTSPLVDVSRDGRHGLLLKSTSFTDAKLVLVDLGDGSTKTVYPDPIKHESVSRAAFSADGSAIYVATDGGDEGAVLAVVDAHTFVDKARFVETHARGSRIEEIAVSKTGDRLALLVDAGNHSEVKILDVRTLKPAPAVDLPLGTGQGLALSGDGTTLTLQWSTPNAPADIFRVETRTGKARPLRQEPRAALAKLPKLSATLSEVPSLDGPRIPVNVYLPDPLPPGKKLKVMVMIHGGPAESSQVGWSSWTRFYTAHGFAVVDPNIRGSTGFGKAYERADNVEKRPAAIKDIEAVGKWVAAQPWADADRMVLFGASYGGYMTLMGLASQPSLWKAGVDVVGIYSWRTFLKTTSAEVHDYFASEIGEGGAFLETISPSSQVSKITAPLFVYAGQGDTRVPREESDLLVRSLRARKIPVEYMVAAHEGHSLERRENKAEFLARSLRFLDAQLGN